MVAMHENVRLVCSLNKPTGRQLARSVMGRI